MRVESGDRVTDRDRYHARAQVAAAVIGSLVAGLLAGLFGGRELEERELEAQITAGEEAVNGLRDQLQERTELIDALRIRVDAQEQTIRDLQAGPAREPHNDTQDVKSNVSGTDSGSTPASEPEPTVIAVQEVAGIELRLMGCSRSGQRVSCDLMIVNHEEDIYLEICAPACYGNQSRLVDSQGIEYKPESSYLGGGYTSRPTAALARAVPLRAGVRFEGVDPKSRSIALLEIGVRVVGGKDYVVQFRYIAIG